LVVAGYFTSGRREASRGFRRKQDGGEFCAAAIFSSENGDG
jgi:hypothetical protein